MKRYVSIICILVIMLSLAGCSKKKPTEPIPPEDGETAAPALFKNNLTGEGEFEDESKTKLRPVAIAVNNQNKTRCHQTGLADADIVYETYVEGGITRTLAIYKDISKLGEVGSIRSARYDFVDLACSNDAVYIHAGVDYTYCQPYMKKLGLDDINLLENRFYGYAYRNDNDHALEHTLFSTGEKLGKMLTDSGRRMTVDEKHSGDWQKFNDTAKKLVGGEATDLTVAFSGDYIDYFKYDTAKGAYTKTGHTDGQKHESAYNDSLDFKNVVVLFTSLGGMGDGYRVNVGLESGDGYYFSNGTYQEINWKKGSTYDSFEFTDKDGNALSYNPGNSWVCIVSRDMRSRFKFQ